MGQKLSFSRRHGHLGRNITANLNDLGENKKQETFELRLMVYFMFFSIQRMNLSAWDLFIANSTEAARIKSKNKHIEKLK